MAFVQIGNYGYDTAANWVGVVVPAGLIAVASDSGVIKKGNGVAVYQDLPRVLADPSPPAVHFNLLSQVKDRDIISIPTITGGVQGNGTVTLIPLIGSDMGPFASNTWYEGEWILQYNTPAVTTGVFLSVSGSTQPDYFRAEITADANANGSSRVINSFDGGAPFLSSRATGGNRAMIEWRMRTTTVGSLVVRFATEIASSIITIPVIAGFYRKMQ